MLDDCGIVPMKRKIKKIFLEVISNTKIFNIKFCSMKLTMIKILPNLQGLDNAEYGSRIRRIGVKVEWHNQWNYLSAFSLLQELLLNLV